MVVFVSTTFTLNEQNMTSVICTIRVFITRFSTLVALCDNFVSYPFPKPFIEDKVFPDEFILKILIFDLSGIFDYSSIYINIFLSFCASNCSAIIGKDSLNVTTSGLMAFLKCPTSLS